MEELLGAGIDVWTTLNVQHLESLVDVVWKITGVRQRETVPDRALSRADEIELIDITPAELRERLAEGKVYVPETARLAADRFFKVENLTGPARAGPAPRGPDRGRPADRRHARAGVEGPWAAGERILVLVGRRRHGQRPGAGRPAAVRHDDGRALDRGPRRAAQRRPPPHRPPLSGCATP